MREIKFKAWNDLDKVMIDWATLRANPALFMGIATGKVKHHTLLQCAGLKDKNGAEVYEGDIVEPTKSGWCTPGLGVIKFKGGAFVNEKDDKNYGFHEICSEFNTVIGNIHQNPELLK